MLDEEEWAQIHPMYEHAVRRAKRAMLRGLTSEQAVDESFGEVLAVYSEMTGRTDHAAHAIMDHRLSKYGPPCRACGKPLRTPEAAHCAACGTQRS
jgi:hypothetical protein